MQKFFDSIEPGTIIAIVLSFFLGLLTQFLVGIWKRSSDAKKELLVECRLAIIGAPWYISGGTEGVANLVRIHVVNNRPRPVTVASAGLALKNKHTFTQLKSSAGKQPLPKRLEDSDSVDIYYDLLEIAKAIKIHNTSLKYAYVQDSSGKIYKAPIPKNVLSKVEYLANF